MVEKFVCKNIRFRFGSGADSLSIRVSDRRSFGPAQGGDGEEDNGPTQENRRCGMYGGRTLYVKSKKEGSAILFARARTDGFNLSKTRQHRDLKGRIRRRERSTLPRVRSGLRRSSGKVGAFCHMLKVPEMQGQT